MIAIGVVAHVARAEMANGLASQVGAEIVSVDDGSLGSGNNHLAVLSALAQSGAQWVVVLEDDAVVVDDFGDQLAAALAVAPSPIVGLFFNIDYPPALRFPLHRAAQLADETRCQWIMSPQVWGVGYAIHVDVLVDLLDDVAGSHMDAAISKWASQRGIDVALSWPSLVDHHDGPTLITDREGTSARGPRRAYRVGTRTHWTASAVRLTLENHL